MKNIKKSDKELNVITDKIVSQILKDGKLKISSIILFGSYARGTADAESDIDIMILCDDDNKIVEERFMDVFHKVDKIAYEHDVMIQTDIKNKHFFDKWKDDLPYYRNIMEEGVVLYG